MDSNDSVTLKMPQVVISDIEKSTESGVTTVSVSDENSTTDLDVPFRETKSLHAKLRWGFMTAYRRFFSLVFVANSIAFVYAMTLDRKLTHFINAASINLLAVGLTRHPYMVNLTYICVCSVPRSAPLKLRWLASKIAHYGGIHSGAAISATMWYIGFVGILTRDRNNPETRPLASPAVLTISYSVLVCLVAIIAVAYPLFRALRHNSFEFTHRFAGWLSIALFWPLLFLLARKAKGEHSLGHYLIRLPAFWIIIMLTVIIIEPWLHLRKIPVVAEPISNHAIRIHFNTIKPRFAMGVSVSRHPLRDWHGFAQFPDVGGEVASALVSRAGDWTGRCIESPPTHLWKRGVPARGFGYCLRMFNSCIVVATGSGIGPCLSFLALEDRPRLRVIWQTRSPLDTYGQRIIDAVHLLDPNAIIIDSSKNAKRKDMLPDILSLVKQEQAEAVGVISNYFFTKRILYEVEARGIPAFGPVFDS